MPKSASERKAAERERRDREGLARVEVYVRPVDRGKVRKYAERLNRRASSLNGAE